MASGGRKDTFDQQVELYDEVRPGYPAQLLGQVVDYARLEAAARIVEVGPGTGKATLYFARRGWRLAGIEPGTNLCAFLRARCTAYPGVEIEQCAFEEWPGEEACFDLFLSAHAFHFIEPAPGLEKAARVLKPGGAIALVWNADYSQDSEFYRRATPLHKKYFPQSGSEPETQRFVSVYSQALSECGLFCDLQKAEHPWSEDYSAEGLIRLRSTFSQDVLLPAATRRQFYSELKELVNEMGGKITRSYRTVALLGRRAS